jgi:two-component system sensor histidine kinase YesM
MLQGQINPHFLHNTLNSIKWMAALQGADGIKEMTNCLGKLLEAVMGEVNQKITLAAELQILDDYLYIQRIRYKGKVDFKKVIADKGILRYLIVKFTLQPLVENAIFHGIEPKRRMRPDCQL